MHVYIDINTSIAVLTTRRYDPLDRTHFLVHEQGLVIRDETISSNSQDDDYDYLFHLEEPWSARHPVISSSSADTVLAASRADAFSVTLRDEKVRPL